MEVLSSLLDNLDEGLLILDKEGKILFFNKVAIAFSRTLAITPFQPDGYLLDSLGLETRELLREVLQEIKRKETPEKTFAEVRNQNGVILSFEFNFIPVINEGGKFTHIHVFIRDITEQRIFEKKITIQAANITNLIENANAIIFGIDTRGYITDWNKHCTTITGFKKNEVYAQKFASLFLNETERPVFDQLIVNGLNRESISNSELLIHHKDGNPWTFLLNCTSRTTTSGEVVGLIFVGQDITELTEYRKSLEMKVEERTKELQRALNKEKEVVEMKNRFVSIASHEFRSPLSAIEFEADLIERSKKLDRKTVLKRLGFIKKQIGHMYRLLDDVLTYGKGETGKIQLVISNIPLPEFLNKIIEEVNHRPEKHFIKTDFCQIPGIIRADEKLLRSILINLLTNAIKFSTGKRQVDLTVNGGGNQIEIIVSDEGIGIPEEELSKIFEPFLRGKAGDGIQGTGLGLSIVKKSIELLNGTIQVKSEVNKGTTFRATIPAQQ